MIREALEFLDEQSKSRVEPGVIEIEGVDTRTLVAYNGTIHTYDHEPPARDHTCLTLESFGRWCGNDGSVIWYSMNQIQLVLEDMTDEFRRNKVTMDLSHSSEFNAVMSGAKGLEQRQFVRWILDHLDRKFEEAAPGLLNTIRQLKFNKSSSGEGKVANGQESFGNEIEAEVAGAAEFPDDITIRVLVWAELDIHVDVRMAFIVNPHEQTLTLRALPASVQQATRDALNQLGSELEQHQGESLLYCGKP